MITDREGGLGTDSGHVSGQKHGVWVTGEEEANSLRTELECFSLKLTKMPLKGRRAGDRGCSACWTNMKTRVWLPGTT